MVHTSGAPRCSASSAHVRPWRMRAESICAAASDLDMIGDINDSLEYEGVVLTTSGRGDLRGGCGVATVVDSGVATSGDLLAQVRGLGARVRDVQR